MRESGHGFGAIIFRFALNRTNTLMVNSLVFTAMFVICGGLMIAHGMHLFEEDHLHWMGLISMAIGATLIIMGVLVSTTDLPA